MAKITFQQKEDSIDQGDELSNNLEDNLMDGSMMSQHQMKQLEFVEYLKKMGMREYDNGQGIIFYEDEYDHLENKEKQLNQSGFSNTMSSAAEEINYYLNLINELFQVHPEAQVRIGYQSEQQKKEEHQSEDQEDDNFQDLEQ